MEETASLTASDGRLSSSRRQHEVSDALVQVCAGEPVKLPADPQIRGKFVRAARHHRVAPLAQVRLRDTETDIAEILRTDRDAAKATYLRSVMLLDGLHQILGDIPWVVFKGPILSEHAHPVPGLRSFTDVDVLVSPTRLRDVSRRLLEAGWQIVDRDDMLRNADTPGETHWISPMGTLVDLHWSMINMADTRRLFPAITEQLLADRIRVPAGLTSAWALPPSDALWRRTAFVDT